MRNIVVDTNIVFTAILNPRSNVGDLMLNSGDCFHFFAPAFLQFEIGKHKDKIKHISGLSGNAVERLKKLVFSRITFISEDQISRKIWDTSSAILSDIDSDDVAFLAVSQHLGVVKIWTGDKPLRKGLLEKGYFTVITTGEIKELRRKIRDI